MRRGVSPLIALHQIPLHHSPDPSSVSPHLDQIMIESIVAQVVTCMDNGILFHLLFFNLSAN